MTRKEAIGRIQEHIRIHSKKEPFTPYLDKAFDMAIEALKEQRPHGEWLSHYDYCNKHGYMPSGLITFWWCNQCEQGVEHPTNFCPKCGADMREEGEQ